MTNKQSLLLNRIKSILISMYFIILFLERLLSAIFSVNAGEEYALASGNVFNYIAYTVEIASLVFGTVFFSRPFIGMCASIVTKKEYPFERKIGEISVAVAALLFGGMMHTGFTLAGVQFVSYGALIGAMVVRCVEDCLSGRDKFSSVTSLIYLTLFSMSIPVCYISFMALPIRIAFFTFEFLSVFVLVPVFGYLFYRYMSEGETPFSPLFPTVMLVLSGVTIGLQWKEEINTFVLIFASATVLFYLVFGYIRMRRLRKAKGALLERIANAAESDAEGAVSEEGANAEGAVSEKENGAKE